MKKIVLMVAVMMIAAPAMADIIFAVADNADGTFTVSYTTTNGDLPRGVAVKVTVDGFDITGATNQMPAFNANIDDLWSGGTFPPGPGVHGLAKDGAPGRFVSGNVAVISAGVLDQGGFQGAGPASGDLITIVTDMVGGDTATVSLSADGLRGPSSGVVGSVIDSNLDPVAGSVTDVPLTFPEVKCIDAGHPDFAIWQQVGEPPSWCKKFQCIGDANGDFEGKDKNGKRIWVTLPDLDILLAGWFKFENDGDFDDFIAADFNHDFEGKDKNGKRIWVTLPDLDILLAGWFKFENVDPFTSADCPGSE